MSYFNLLLLCLVPTLNWNESQFVALNYDNIVITRAKNEIMVTLPFTIREGYHIQSNIADNTDLIATTVVFNVGSGSSLISYEFLIEEYKSITLGNKKLNVIDREFEIEVHMQRLSSQNLKLQGKLYYQTCDDKKCYFPRTLDFEIELDRL